MFFLGGGGWKKVNPLFLHQKAQVYTIQGPFETYVTFS